MTMDLDNIQSVKLLPLLHFDTETQSTICYCRTFPNGIEVRWSEATHNFLGSIDETKSKSSRKRHKVYPRQEGDSKYYYDKYGFRYYLTFLNLSKPLYLKDGTELAYHFNRVVHGERGDYVEFDEKDLCIKIYYKFKKQSKLDIYYDWMIPVGHKDVKIYKQRKTVKYADYKVGKLYISPDLLSNFTDPEKLNFKD